MKLEAIFSGKDVDEAIDKAVEQLGAPNKAALVVTVLHEARHGFLGIGNVDAEIHVVYQKPDEQSAEQADKKVEDRTNRPDRNGRGRRQQKHRSGNRHGARPEEAAEPEKEQLPEVNYIDPETATKSEQVAYRFILTVLEDMGITDAKVGMHPGDNDDMVITVSGENAGLLIGHHGETLDALQYLANLAANRREEGEKHEYARITLDIEDYRAKRENTLRILARKKAQQVQKTKKSVILEPMSPYERRIIHSEVQKIDGVTTNSIGLDNNRRVVIYLESAGMDLPEGITETVDAKATAPAKSGKSGSKSGRSRRRKKAADTAKDPFEVEGGSEREHGPSVFDSEDSRDPFDLDSFMAMAPDEDAENSGDESGKEE